METSNAQKNLGPVMATRIEEVEDRLWLYTFPDGFRCYSHSGEQETQLIYNEIFVKAEYLGDTLSLDDCRYVVDVGANIGLFTLFTKLRNPNLVVHAFEPIKATYDVLLKNIELHGLTDVYPHNYALGNEDGAERTLTFYPNAAGITTAYPESKEALKRYLAEVLGQETANYIFHAPQVHTVQTRTLSALLDEATIPVIDLLKIDVEGDELAVLQGIAPRHSPLVRQISAEVHSDALWSAIHPLLTRLGFRVFSRIGIANFESAGGNNLYAIKE